MDVFRHKKRLVFNLNEFHIYICICFTIFFAKTKLLNFVCIKFKFQNWNVSKLAKHKNPEIVFFRIALQYIFSNSFLISFTYD